MAKSKFAERHKTKPKSIKSKKVLSGKRALSRMGKKQKAGHAGVAVEFVGRTRVVKELGLSIADFRRLCVLKGVYPRAPPHLRGLDARQTYYHHKDVAFLRSEPLLKKFRALRAFMKKLKRAVGRADLDAARRLYAGRPVYTLDHLVRERYPRFEDALGDLDDALSLVHLLAALPAGDPVRPEHTATARRLAREWAYIVARSHALRKVFLSIKGVYFSAELRGVTVTWLVPWPFAQTPPADVDYRVMLTFLELAEVTLRFTQFKLYHDAGLAYPPRIRAALDEGGHALAALDVRAAPAGGAGAGAGAGAGGAAPRHDAEAPARAAAAHTAAPDVGVSAVPDAVARRMANTAALKVVMAQIAAADAADAADPDEGAPGVGGGGGGGGGGGSRRAGGATATGALVRGKGKRAAGGYVLPPDAVPSMYDFVDAEDGGEGGGGGGEGGGEGDGGGDGETGDLAAFAALGGGGGERDESADAARAVLAAARASRAFARLFRGLVFFLGREVPRDVFEFLICAFSGRVGWDGPGSPYAPGDARITHAVVDRPPPPPGAPGPERVPGREYVQPQWVADCVNARMLLPVARYAPGAVLPPHLSPFVDDAAAGYVPAYRLELDRLRAAAAVTGRLADVLTAAAADAAALPRDADGRVNRLGGAGAGAGGAQPGEEDEEEEGDDDEEDDEDDDDEGGEGDGGEGGSETEGDDDDDDDDDAAGAEDDDAGALGAGGAGGEPEEEEEDDEEGDEAALAVASGRAAPPAAAAARAGARGGKRAAALAAAEDERRALAASMLSGVKRRAYEAGRAARDADAARVEALRARAAAAARAGDEGVGRPAPAPRAHGGAPAPPAPPAAAGRKGGAPEGGRGGVGGGGGGGGRGGGGGGGGGGAGRSGGGGGGGDGGGGGGGGGDGGGGNAGAGKKRARGGGGEPDKGNKRARE